MAPAIDLDTIVLERGAHASIEDGGCIMEWTAYLAGEPHSDHPACVSGVNRAHDPRERGLR